MIIQSPASPQRALGLQGGQPQPPQNPEPPQEKWDSVTFDASTKTYHFQRPGHHYSASLQNPLSEGLIAASVVGIPSAFGAGSNVLLGGLGATAVTAISGPAVGAALGGVLLGRGAYKESRGNPFFTGLAAMVGAGVGAVGFPLLSLPGTWGGVTGALVAAAGVGTAAGVWTAVRNNKLHQKALDAGYKPAQ